MPPRLRQRAARSPAGIMSHVTPLAESVVASSTRVAYGDSRRMKSRPAQCSAPGRARRASGCVTALSSAIEGTDEPVHALRDLVLVHVEVLQDRVPLRTGRRRVCDGGRELLVREAEIPRQPRDPVAHECRVERLEPAVLAEEGREERTD